jgi:glucokinase
MDVNMILAGDVGGTKTLLGLFDSRGLRPAPLVVREIPTLDYPDLLTIVESFAMDAGRDLVPTRACFGVAGPVLGDTAELTNVPFRIDARAISNALTIPRVRLLNDLEAMAYAVPVLDDAELRVLQAGTRHAAGNMALIAAGTGLGEAVLHNIDGRFVPSPTEAGHADWAARSERDIDVLRALIQRFGRAEVEDVLSGRGLTNLHRVTHRGDCLAVEDPEDPDAPAAISRAALERRCRGCIDALDIFVAAYGAEAGNLTLRSVATGGLFVGGGIAPKILPALTDGRFIREFQDKGEFRALLANVPVSIILNAQAGLLGAAVAAAG